MVILKQTHSIRVPVYTYSNGIITCYWHFAARAVVTSKISFLLSVHVRPVAVVGATRTNELELMRE